MSTTWHPGQVLAGDELTPDVTAAIKEALSPVQVVGLTAWAEARSRLEPRRGWISNPIEAMADIVNVIDNRAKDPRWAAVGHKGVCLARRQFSCWDSFGGLTNFRELMVRAQRLLAGGTPSDKVLDCLALAAGCLSGTLVDSLEGATHYFAPLSMLVPGSAPPWAKPPARCVAERYGHRFFVNVR